jgi:signal transduction histidine kinase
MVAYPILLTLPQRFASAAPVRPSSQPARSAAKSDNNDASSGGNKRYSADPKTFQALLALAAETNPTKVSQAITRAIAQTMLSDLCFLLYLTDNNSQMVIAGGYDLIREDNLQGGSLNKNSIPMLANSLQRGRPLRMPASSTSADIKGLGDVLGLTTPGHLLSVPIVTPDKETLGGVLLLSPYSDRTWTAEDQAFLANVSTSLVPIIQRSQKMSKMEMEHERTVSQVSDLERRVFDLTKQLDAARAENEKNNSAEIASLRIAQEDSQRIIEQLQLENAGLRSNKAAQPLPASAAVSTTQVEKELRAALQEMARLQNQLAEVSMKAHQYENIQKNEKVTDQAEVIMSISQDLRQPLSSIIGYTDLLLGETVGILGALQRKFVERIKASTERLNSLLDDMLFVTNLGADANDLKHEQVDLNALLDNAMSYTSAQVREKNISINLDLPKKLAPVQADRDALQQILIHLLQNASAATPYEGTIKIKVETRIEGQAEYILIQVADTGVGIPVEDLPQVFTRLYHAETKPIQGVGDTGVGLSIAKTLIEAHRGRIWVESQVGVGSTFSILLPMTGSVKTEKKAEKEEKGHK